jgi:predicted enzyme related to lactoylglutathione lyase
MPKLCHWEIPTTDSARSQKFYTELFGWKTQMAGMGEEYVLVIVDGGVGGALMKVEKMPEPCIRIYVEVEDMPAVLDRVVKMGGKVGQPKTDIGGGFGFAGSFFDPCGCLVGLWSKE